MKVLQTSRFKDAVKKLHPNQKSDLDKAVKAVSHNPHIGTAKVGDLVGVFIYKFKMAKQLALLAYTHDNHTATLTLLALGSHENFYRDLKRTVH